MSNALSSPIKPVISSWNCISRVVKHDFPLVDPRLVLLVFHLIDFFFLVLVVPSPSQLWNKTHSLLLTLLENRVTFSFFPSLGTSPSNHDHSSNTKNFLTLTFSSSFRTRGCILSGSPDLHTFNLFKYSLIWLSSTRGAPGSHGNQLSRSLMRPKSDPLKPSALILLFALLLPLRIQNSTI